MTKGKKRRISKYFCWRWEQR